ncbi:MAG: hypothetical protein KJ872_01335 [Alphaproteobacteria bacterium]|nr:hypothetical protein [Alphaproteobacteria bacterium]
MTFQIETEQLDCQGRAPKGEKAMFETLDDVRTDCINRLIRVAVLSGGGAGLAFAAPNLRPAVRV